MRVLVIYLGDTLYNLGRIFLELRHMRRKNHSDISYSHGPRSRECLSKIRLRRENDDGLTRRLILWNTSFFLNYFQSRSQSFVPLDQRSENESSGSIHFQITVETTEFRISGFTAQCAVCIYGIYGACLKWMRPELSFSDRWSKGTKLWERDCPSSCYITDHNF